MVKTFELTLWLCAAILAATATESGAATLEPGHCYTWGINPQESLPLERGQIITEAVLTVYNVHLDVTGTDPITAGSVPRSLLRPEYDAETYPVSGTSDCNTLRVYVLDDPRYGYWPLSNEPQNDDPFAGFGGLLTADLQQGNLIYRLSQTHNPNNWTENFFGNLASVTLANGYPIILSSSLLEFIDYAGTGYGVGFGIRSGEKRYYYDHITLTVTVESYEGVYTNETFVCQITDGPSPANPYTLVTTAVHGRVDVLPEAPAYSDGQTVMLTATAYTGYTFSGWSGDVTGTVNPITITMNGNKSIIANFAENSRSSQRGI